MINTTLKLNQVDPTLNFFNAASKTHSTKYYYNELKSALSIFDINQVPNYASFDRDGIDLLDQSCFFANYSTNIKWISTHVTQDDGAFLQAEIPVFYITNTRSSLEHGITLYFKEIDEIDFEIELHHLDGSTTILDNYSNNAIINKKSSPIYISKESIHSSSASYITYIALRIKKIHNVAFGSFNLYGVQFGKFENIASWSGEITCYHDVHLPSDDMSIGTMDANLFFDESLKTGQELSIEIKGMNYMHMYRSSDSADLNNPYSNSEFEKEPWEISYVNTYIITNAEYIDPFTGLQNVHCEDLISALDYSHYSAQSEFRSASPSNIEKITGIPIIYDNTRETSTDDTIKIAAYLSNLTSETTCRQWLASYCTMDGSVFTTFNSSFGIKEIKIPLDPAQVSENGNHDMRDLMSSIIYSHQIFDVSILRSEQHYLGVISEDVSFYYDNRDLLYGPIDLITNVRDELAAYHKGYYAVVAPMLSYITNAELASVDYIPANFSDDFFGQKVFSEQNKIAITSIYFNGDELSAKIIYHNEQLGSIVGIEIPNKHVYIEGKVFTFSSDLSFNWVTGIISAIELHIGNTVTADIKVKIYKRYTF